MCLCVSVCGYMCVYLYVCMSEFVVGILRGPPQVTTGLFRIAQDFSGLYRIVRDCTELYRIVRFRTLPNDAVVTYENLG